MRIAYITAGAAGMYCGSCLHDNTLAAALKRMGHEVTLIPTYTPIRTDEEDVSIDRVFYGAINVFLEQRSSLFRRTPEAIDRLLNSPALLNWVTSRGASSTDARTLGALTLSVLQGEAGKQRKELEKLVRWLADDVKPELVHLTNSMFLGMAQRLREELRVPVVCSVQGEDIFLEELVEPYLGQVREELQRRAAGVDGFIATSRYYRDFMTDYLGIPAAKMHHVRLGLNLEGHGPSGVDKGERPFMIGYLARLCPEKGLHVIAEAFRRLAAEAGREQVRLRIAGWMGPRDREYVEGIRGRLRDWGLEQEVDFVGEVDRRQKIEFLQAAHVLAVPTTYREPKGLYVLEALANGVPVVQPRHGAFPELIEATGGGLLHEPGNVDDLVQALKRLMHDAPLREKLGRQGHAAVHADFRDTGMAEETLALYRALLAD